MTILLVGSDNRSAIQPASAAGQERQFNDAVMLVHLDADRKAVSVIAIPRSAWINVPGFGEQGLFRALDLGGPPLLIKTVERLTGIRIDHYAEMDFAGMRQVIQVLGGVQVQIAGWSRRGNVTFHKGLNTLTPREAMVYVSTTTRPAGCRCWQRNGLPGGDLTRAQRQENLLRAIFAKIASWHLLSDPIELYRLLQAFGGAVRVDSTFTNAQLRTLTLQLAQLHGNDFTFLTAPASGIGERDDDGVVFLNRALCGSLWNAVRHDAVAAWAAKHPAALTPDVPY